MIPVGIETRNGLAVSSEITCKTPGLRLGEDWNAYQLLACECDQAPHGLP